MVIVCEMASKKTTSTITHLLCGRWQVQCSSSEQNESLEATIAHFLHVICKRQTAVRQLWKHGHDNLLQTRWDTTSTIRHERVGKAWIRWSLTYWIRYDKHSTSWEGCESLDSMNTHLLDEIWQTRCVMSLRRLRIHGFNDHSHTRWSATRTIRRKTAEKEWIRRSLTA